MFRAGTQTSMVNMKTYRRDRQALVRERVPDNGSRKPHVTYNAKDNAQSGPLFSPGAHASGIPRT